MKRPKLPPMPEMAPAPRPATPAQMPSSASAMGGQQAFMPLGARFAMGAFSQFASQRAGRKSLIGS